MFCLREVSTAFKFSIKAFSSKLTFPKIVCATGPSFSFLTSILPFLICSTAFSTSSVTVPVLGFGMTPAGPNTFAALASFGMYLGSVTITSKSIRGLSFPLASLSISSSVSSKSALAIFLEANTATFLVLPVPFGNTIVYLIFCSVLAGSISKFM